MTTNTLRSNVDGYGFQRPEGFDFDSYEKFMSSYLTILARRSARWTSIVKSKGTVSKSTKVKRFCRKGIPAEHRPMVWMNLSGAAQKMKENPGLYEQILKEDYDPKLVETVSMDINRTFPENIYFAVSRDRNSLQRPLFNVLVAIGHKNSKVEYCQGMNFVVALMLLVMKNEEKAFWLMDTLINDILPDYYNPNMNAIKVEQEVLGELVRLRDPELHNKIEKLEIPWCLIGIKWFLCLFADVLPTETVLRIWDCLFFEGPKILLRVAVTIILINKDKFMRCTNFSEGTTVLRNIVNDSMSVMDCHAFIQRIFTEPKAFPRSQIKKLRKECITKIR
ncbi:hypothetical protein CHS0354_005499 [Potamilus streckersoni]|uniref:Growth hormone-regulated TBC protein 1 n=1 Tax=Potamilus streckersoni TaxID=2493646 RepID=A0AAE0SVE4_9BIVA|nr:hypothetical protein CHS0354_005499 [Potamilus streckersoni]